MVIELDQRARARATAMPRVMVGAILTVVSLWPGCKEPATVLEVSVNVEPGVSIDAITVTASAPGKRDYRQTFEPQSIVAMRIQVEGLLDRTPVSVQAEGTRAGSVVVLQRAVVALRAGKVNSRSFDFTPECAGLTCLPTQTCDHGACVEVPADGADGGAAAGGSDGQTARPDASGGQAGAAFAATGGASASGGAAMGSGGASSSGGAGGSTAACQTDSTKCSANGVQTCDSKGQWAMTVFCEANQACTEAGGSAKCTCTSTCTAGTTECTSSTALGSCTAGADGCNVPGTTACGGDLVCERIEPASCGDPTWAEWPVPPSESPGGYMDNGDGTVTDIITRLMWEKASVTAATTQAAAATYCATTRTGGHSDWRLPAKIELLSIVDYGRLGPSIHPVFTGTGSTSYWTSTPNLMMSAPWMVDFAGGSTTNRVVSGMPNVRCVR